MRSSVTFELKGNLRSPAFRPFVWKEATEAGLGGWIAEKPDGAILRLEGDDDSIGSFIRSLAPKLPRSLNLTAISLVQKIAAPPLQPDEPHSFKVIGPVLGYSSVDADRAPCPDCVQKMLEPESRFYHYPFVSCAKCGPRYSVQTLSPFNRGNSAFMAFPPCKECSHNMQDSDSHKGNPIESCPFCGPSALLMDRNGSIVDSYSPLETACESLDHGGIISVKTYDGFITLCNGLNDDAIMELRKRKNLSSKPLSIMARDIDVVRKYCHCSPAEAELLTSPAAPVVILKPLEDSPLTLNHICPDYPQSIGVALPPTAMLRLLFESRPTMDSLQGQFDLFAFAGGPKPVNPDDAGGDDDFNEIGHYSDYILNHDLKIWQNGGSSVLTIQNEKPIMWRRSRGISPSPLKLSKPLRRVSLALGSDQSAAVALGCRNSVAVSQQMGNILNDRNARSLSLVGERLLLLYAQIPDILVCDMDINSLSAREALRFAERYSLPLATAQRHHANAIACMVEHSVTESLALILDGGAYGPDGMTWGAEMMAVSYHSFSRLCSFAPEQTPAEAEHGIFSNPRTLFLKKLNSLGLNPEDTTLSLLGLSREDHDKKVSTFGEIEWKKTQAALPLFNAVGAALSLYPEQQTYDMQTIIHIEAAVANMDSLAGAVKAKHYFAYHLRDDDGLMVVDWSDTFRNLAAPHWMSAFSRADLAMGFLLAITEAIVAMAEYAASKSHLRSIALSGTAFISFTLSRLAVQALERKGFKVYTHEKTSPDESSVCIGQAVFGGMS